MRDFLLNESIKRLATETATRLSSLVAMGEEIPFDVAADAGDDSAFYSYVPMTGRYVVDHAEELRALPSFAAAREATVEAGVAASYLEARGEAVPADPGARAELMLITFFSELWEGSAGFALDRERLEAALATLDAEARDADDAEVLMAPIVGLRMSMPRLQLPHGMRIVRADSIEAPVEAMRSEGMGRAAWEPQYLAVADQDAEGGAETALQQLRELISVMRMFKGGGIGLGPYAFAPTGEGCWRRIATGAPATRPGGYRLSEDEAEELVRVRTGPGGAAGPRQRPHLGRRPLRDGLRARDRAGGLERPPAGDARRARGPRPGRRLAAAARGGADRRRGDGPDRGRRTGRAGARAGAGDDERSPDGACRRACDLDRGGRPGGCCAKPRSGSSATTSAPSPTRP